MGKFENLLGLLEKNEVKVRWLSFHNNGLPEANSISTYSGLRTILLTERLAWVPAILGLNYHVFLNWPGNRRERAQAVTRLVSGEPDERRLWSERLLAQVEEMQSSSRSFLLVHTSFSKHLVQVIAESDGGEGVAELSEFYDDAVARDYVYDIADEPLVRSIREKYQRRTDEMGAYLSNLFRFLSKSGRLDDTLVIMTADHGTILDDGKIWYGFHADEQVTRVPLVMWSENLAGEEAQAVDTVDLARTLVEYFDVNTDFAAPGRNLLLPIARLREIPVLTVASDQRKEHFVVLYKGAKKLMWNIHPEGDGAVQVQHVREFSVTDEGEAGPSFPADAGKVMKVFGFDREKVHPRFKNML